MKKVTWKGVANIRQGLENNLNQIIADCKWQNNRIRGQAWVDAASSTRSNKKKREEKMFLIMNIKIKKCSYQFNCV